MSPLRFLRTAVTAVVIARLTAHGYVPSVDFGYTLLRETSAAVNHSLTALAAGAR